MGRVWPPAAFLALTSCIADGGRVDVAASLPPDWVSVAAPRLGTWEERCANWAREEYSVRLSDDSSALVIAGPTREYLEDTVAIADGRFLLRGRREGGEVWFQSSPRDSQFVAAVDLGLLVPTDKGLVGVIRAGVAAEGMGAVVGLQRDASGAWTLRSQLDIGGLGRLSHRLPNDTLLIITNEGRLLEVSAPAHLRELHHEPVWYATYPNSLVRDRAGNIFVGMRSGVVRVQPSGDRYEAAWFAPASCARREVDTLGTCTCVTENRGA